MKIRVKVRILYINEKIRVKKFGVRKNGFDGFCIYRITSNNSPLLNDLPQSSVYNFFLTYWDNALYLCIYVHYIYV